MYTFLIPFVWWLLEDHHFLSEDDHCLMHVSLVMPWSSLQVLWHNALCVHEMLVVLLDFALCVSNHAWIMRIVALRIILLLTCLLSDLSAPVALLTELESSIICCVVNMIFYKGNVCLYIPSLLSSDPSFSAESKSRLVNVQQSA